MCILKLSLRSCTSSFLLSVSITKLLVCSVRFTFLCSDGQEELGSCYLCLCAVLGAAFFLFYWQINLKTRTNLKREVAGWLVEWIARWPFMAGVIVWIQAWGRINRHCPDQFSPHCNGSLHSPAICNWSSKKKTGGGSKFALTCYSEGTRTELENKTPKQWLNCINSMSAVKVCL